MTSASLTDVENSKLATSSTDSPVFIVGMSRSGTTLLSRMLDAHSEIAILPETWWYVVLDRFGCLEEFSDPWQTSLFFHEVWGNLKSYRDPAARVVAREASKGPRYVGPTAPLLERIGQAYAAERGARIWGEKTPAHALWLPQICKLFPRARVLFMVRDPRDVLVSYDERWDEGRRETGYVLSAAALLKHYLTHLLRRPSFPLDQIHWVRYESLAAQPQAELEQICRFLRVEFEPSMLTFYRRNTNVGTDMRHHALLKGPATPEKIGCYQQALSSSQIAMVEQLFGNEMRALGYPLAHNVGQIFDQDQQQALAKAQGQYEEMASGEIRRKFRRKGKLKLRAYQVFGRVFDLIPFRRVPTTDKEWLALAEDHKE